MTMTAPRPSVAADITVSAEPNSFFVVVTPDQAQRWLDERNVGNRARSAARERLYASEMVSDAWMTNGDTICFSWDGVLLDGQTRLHAIIKAGVAINCLIVTGLDPKVRPTIDQGRKRTAAHELAAAGHVNTHQLGSAANLCWAYDSRLIGKRGASRQRATTAQIIDFVDAHADTLAEAVRRGRQMSANVGGTVSVSAAAYWIIKRAAPGRLAAFWEPLVENDELRRGTPAHTLHRRLRLAGRADQLDILAAILKAWNAWMRGEGTELLVWRDNEPFPRAAEVATDA